MGHLDANRIYPDIESRVDELLQRAAVEESRPGIPLIFGNGMICSHCPGPPASGNSWECAQEQAQRPTNALSLSCERSLTRS